MRRPFLFAWALLLAGIFCLGQQPSSRAWWQSVPQVSVSGGGVTFDLAFQSHAEDTSNASIITYPAMSWGAADPNRVLAIGLWSRLNANTDTITSVTFGGNGATHV